MLGFFSFFTPFLLLFVLLLSLSSSLLSLIDCRTRWLFIEDIDSRLVTGSNVVVTSTIGAICCNHNMDFPEKIWTLVVYPSCRLFSFLHCYCVAIPVHSSLTSMSITSSSLETLTLVRRAIGWATPRTKMVCNPMELKWNQLFSGRFRQYQRSKMG